MTLEKRNFIAGQWQDGAATVENRNPSDLSDVIGQYAQARYLGKRRKSSMTDTVAHWRDYAPRYWPMPHPSWRNNGWLRKHGWFEADLLPALRAHIAG